MAITKKTQNRNAMLFMLASLACGRNDKKAVSSTKRFSMHPAPAVSDISDDNITVTHPPVKEIVVARRRRRPIKKRIPVDDSRSLSSSSTWSTITRGKSLLESSFNIISRPQQVIEADQVECREETTSSARDQQSEIDEADQSVPVLVCDDEAYKRVHSPLALPSFLPCPAAALRDVKSICLTLDSR
jgi:hypothetical protein